MTCDTKALPGMSIPGYVAEGRTYVTAIHALILLLDRASLKAVPKMPGPKKADTVTKTTSPAGKK